MTTRMRPLLPYAEASLVALTLVTALGFWRLFDDVDFFPRLAAYALASHGIAIVTRRRGLSLPVAATISVAGAVVVTGVVLFPDTTFAGLPTADTIGAIRDSFGDLWLQFQEVKAPTPVTVPFLLAAGLGLWWAAFVADWAAFRLWVPFESIVPASTVFVFASLFAAERGRAAATGLFLAAAIGFLLVHRVTRQQSSGGWVSTDVQRATNSLLRAGAWLGGCAVVAAMIVGPSLPDATAEGLMGWRDVGDDDTRLVDDPFIDIKSQLVQLSSKEVFTVVSDQPANWRLTALDEFDGQRWRANGSFDGASEKLPKKYEGGGNRLVVNQHFTITALSKVWVPAAYEAQALDTSDAEVQWDGTTSSLIVVREVENSNGLAYDVQSAIPTPNADELRAASGEVPEDIQEQFTQLPPDFSGRVRTLAEQVTATEPTAYDKALALQNFLRGPDFSYSLDVSIGEDTSAIENFLFDVRTGYCQQFAGSFGAMARAVGLPTRIAIGYTPGQRDDNGVYHVRGEYAHAWPEVFIGGIGWVSFEPTPGRGAPHAEQYTGVQQEQALPGGVGTETAPRRNEETPIGGGQAPISEPELAPDGGFSDLDQLGREASEPGESWWQRWDRHIYIGLGVAVALVVLYVIVVPLAFAIRRHRRRSRSSEPGTQVRVAWAESVESVGTLGLRPVRSETPAEFAARSDPILGAELLREIAPVLEAADFSVDGVSEDDADVARSTAKAVTTAVRHRASRQQRVRAALDPRPPDRRRRRRSAKGSHGARLDAPAIEVVTID